MELAGEDGEMPSLNLSKRGKGKTERAEDSGGEVEVVKSAAGSNKLADDVSEIVPVIDTEDNGGTGNDVDQAGARRRYSTRGGPRGGGGADAPGGTRASKGDVTTVFGENISDEDADSELGSDGDDSEARVELEGASADESAGASDEDDDSYSPAEKKAPSAGTKRKAAKSSKPPAKVPAQEKKKPSKVAKPSTSKSVPAKPATTPTVSRSASGPVGGAKAMRSGLQASSRSDKIEPVQIGGDEPKLRLGLSRRSRLAPLHKVRDN